MVEITREQLKNYQASGGKMMFTGSKYKNKRQSYKGHGYDSKAELAFAMHLELLKANGTIGRFYRQVPIHLPACEGVRGTIYRLDFLVQMADGHLEHLDVKGMDTQTSKVKRSVASSIIGEPIKCVKMSRNGTFDWEPRCVV